MKKILSMLMLLAALIVPLHADFSLPDVNEIGFVNGPSFAFAKLDASSIIQLDYHFTVTGADYEENGLGVGYLVDMSVPVIFSVDKATLTQSMYNPVMFTAGLSIQYRHVLSGNFSVACGLGFSAGYGIRVYEVSSEEDAVSYGLIRISAYADVTVRYRLFERMLLRGGFKFTAPLYTRSSSPAFPASGSYVTVNLYGVSIQPYLGVSYLY